ELEGTRAAPESATVDVTPRRLQRFSVAPGQWCAWQATELGGPGGQSGSVQADSLGLVTVPGVRVYRLGTVLSVFGSATGMPVEGAPGRLALTVSRNPARGTVAFQLQVPRAGEASVRLMDVGGRVVRVLWHGIATPGKMQLPLDTRSLPEGV